jgi:hypothetical protein
MVAIQFFPLSHPQEGVVVELSQLLLVLVVVVRVVVLLALQLS